MFGNRRLNGAIHGAAPSPSQGRAPRAQGEEQARGGDPATEPTALCELDGKRGNWAGSCFGQSNQALLRRDKVCRVVGSSSNNYWH